MYLGGKDRRACDRTTTFMAAGSKIKPPKRQGDMKKKETRLAPRSGSRYDATSAEAGKPARSGYLLPPSGTGRRAPDSLDAPPSTKSQAPDQLISFPQGFSLTHRSFTVRSFLGLTMVIAAAGLSACDRAHSNLERAVLGGAIGCAIGEVLVDGRCVEGAAAGAGVAVLTN